MLNVAEFLHDLRDQGIELRLAGGDNLVCNAPKDLLTPDIRATIQRHKSDIMTFLKPLGNDTWSPLVAIQAEGSLPPFFCIHGVGGNVLNYSILARYLGPDQPIYGLQSVGLDGMTPPAPDIETMAAEYIRRIRTVQAKGPWYLGGGSMGGVVALEMARQLKAEGDVIGLLVMFDTIGPNIIRTGTLPPGKAGGWQGCVVEMRHRNPLVVLWSKVANKWDRYRRFHICRRCLRDKQPIPSDYRFWYIEEANYKAMYSYTYRKYDGDIVLIRGHVIEEGSYLSDPMRGWTGVAEEVRVCPIVGDHESLVEQPELGEVLAKCLREARALHECGR